ncbi:MAG: DUF5684 domain-containing protein [Pirellulales bacterium]
MAGTQIPSIFDVWNWFQGATSGTGSILALVAGLFVVAGFWKMFEKAGKPPWGALIPIYNVILIAEIAGRPIWWALLWCVCLFIPCLGWIVGAVIWFIFMWDIALRFGKSVLFAIGMYFFLPIFAIILGFGKAQYR